MVERSIGRLMTAPKRVRQHLLEGQMEHGAHRHSSPAPPFWIRVFGTVPTLAVESAQTGK